MIYNSREEVLEALRSASKGQERADILSVQENRDKIKSSGANVTFYSGELLQADTLKETLRNIHIGLIARRNSKTGKPDGLGALGGLSERTGFREFLLLSPKDRTALVGQRDDVVMSGNHAILIDDIDRIRLNNVLREVREELGNLGITDYKFDSSRMELVPMDDVRDDNFAINIWNGIGDVWAITPYCHIMKTQEEVLDNLVNRSHDKKNHEEDSEALEFLKCPLFHALKSYGNFAGQEKLEDGRNAETDYRYPHEWLSAWYIASKMLHHDDDKMLRLAQEVQAETPWKISFSRMAQKMGKDLSFVAEVLNIKPETVQKMENLQPLTLQNRLNRCKQ